jgi:hypothetical protein
VPGLMRRYPGWDAGRKSLLDRDLLTLIRFRCLRTAISGWFTSSHMRMTAAIAELHKARELDPSFVIAHNLLAVAYAAQSKFPQSHALPPPPPHLSLPLARYQ